MCILPDESKRTKKFIIKTAVVSSDLSSQRDGIGSGNSASDRP